MGSRTETRTVTEEREVVVAWTCDRCLLDIPSGDYGPKDALPVSLSGSYGGYFDCVGSGPRWLLCKACADALMLAFPFLNRALGKFIRAEFGLTDDEEGVIATTDALSGASETHRTTEGK